MPGVYGVSLGNGGDRPLIRLEQGARTTSEPFMDSDDRSVALLDLFFPQRQGGRKPDIVVSFDHGFLVTLIHERPSARERCWRVSRSLEPVFPLRA